MMKVEECPRRQTNHIQRVPIGLNIVHEEITDFLKSRLV